MNEHDPIKTEFSYFRDYTDTIRVVICNLRQGDKAARGIALCSLRDTPNAKLGRKIAFGRAQKALRWRRFRSPMRSEHAYAILAKCGIDHIYFEQPKESFYVENENEKRLAATGTG